MVFILPPHKHLSNIPVYEVEEQVMQVLLVHL